MNTNLLRMFSWLLVTSLLVAGCSNQKVKIISVERVNSFGYEGLPTANARPGYDILLVEIKTDEDISPFGGDLVLKDDKGNSYPMGGRFSGKYIFQVPEGANNLTLVVKDTIEVSLP